MNYLPLDPADARLKRDKDKSIILVCIAWRETGAYLRRVNAKRYSPFSEVSAKWDACLYNIHRRHNAKPKAAL